MNAMRGHRRLKWHTAITEAEGWLKVCETRQDGPLRRQELPQAAARLAGVLVLHGLSGKRRSDYVK